MGILSGIGGDNREGKGASQEVRPVFEQLEPRLLLNADFAGIGPVVTPDTPSIEYAICVDLDEDHAGIVQDVPTITADPDRSLVIREVIDVGEAEAEDAGQVTELDDAPGTLEFGGLVGPEVGAVETTTSPARAGSSVCSPGTGCVVTEVATVTAHGTRAGWAATWTERDSVPASSDDTDTDTDAEWAKSVEARGPPAQTQATSVDPIIFVDSRLKGCFPLENSGCAVGIGKAGREFLGQISAIAGADLAAYSNVTGAAEEGGGWGLEVTLGSIDKTPSTRQGSLVDFPEVLGLTGPVSTRSGHVGGLSVSDTTLVSQLTDRVDYAASPVVVFDADFSDSAGNPDLDGFVIDNTGATVTGLWHTSTGRGSESGHTIDDSMYFGTGEGSGGGGHYDVGHTAGRITSPMIDLRGIKGVRYIFWK